MLGWLARVAGRLACNMLGVFLGAEAVKGWIVSDVSPWLAGFADWPLYLSLATGAVCAFLAGNWFLGVKIAAFAGRKLKGTSKRPARN